MYAVKKKKTKSDKPTVKTYNVNKSLKCDLTQPELLLAGLELAEACDAKAKLDEEKKSVVANFAARLKEKDAQISILQSKVQNRFEFRQVPCEEQHDFAAGIVKTVRKDTGDVEEVRAMTEDEKQGSFDFDSKKAADEATV